MRIGAVSYLNTKPLIHGLAERLPEARLSLDLPSRLADALGTGELDVGLIPVFEAFRQDGAHIVSDACIACRGPVWSVKLLSRTRLSQVRSVALDEGSRTSAALTRIWLGHQIGIEPEYRSWPIQQRLDEIEADAVLIIGDRAMRDSFPGFSGVWDLGQVWWDWTGLPFVFACWVSRGARVDTRVMAALEQARDAGMADVELIADREASRYGLSRERCLAYLRDDLHFRLQDAELEGLRRFRRLAMESGLIPTGNELMCHGCTLA